MPSDKSLPVYEALQTLVPELAESEDEKTRKEILNYILYKASGVSEEDEHRWVTWLEKQKYNRMQPVYDNQESFESALDKAWKSYNDSGARTVDGCEDNYTECAYAKGFREGYLFGLEKQKDLDKMIVVSPEVWDTAISDAYENGRKDGEKQKEQKPDSLIYDKDLDKAAREFYLSGGAASLVDSTGLVPIVRMAEFGATWMKERMEKEQKPCWNPSEEDVALFNKAITTNASLSPQERAKLDILRMKFKHRPVIEQKEQKPAWSEGDENIIEGMIMDYRGEIEHLSDSIIDEQVKPVYQKRIELLKRLKSLRPSWKPSEEQMYILNWVANILLNHDGIVEEEASKKLQSLYNDLKKLM